MQRSRYWEGVLARLRRRALAAITFALLFWLYEKGRAASVGDSVFDPRAVALNTSLLLPALVGPILIEALELRSRLRFLAAVAATLGATACTAFAAAVLSRVTGLSLSTAVELGNVISTDAFLLRMWWTYSLAGMLFNAYCQAREHEVQTIRAMRTAELARVDARREVVEMRLKVLQARVEPNLLFGALADVRRAYERDPAAAEDLLDDLIAYLRAALPQMRGEASTLAREAHLAAAYVRVLPAGREGALQATLAIDVEAGEAEFPPMVLLPLVHAAADAGATRITLLGPAASAVDGVAASRLQIEAALTVIPDGWSQDALRPLRATLTQWFGQDAVLEATLNRGVARALLAWPATRPAAASRSTTPPDASIAANATR